MMPWANFPIGIGGQHEGKNNVSILGQCCSGPAVLMSAWDTTSHSSRLRNDTVEHSSVAAAKVHYDVLQA